ncbi:MAG: hypothetical protein IPL31_02115 [Saprospiraceae bacterium]|nr:hypothetical protein [Saprospiraceae bacterium]
MDELLSIPAFSKVFEYNEYKTIQVAYLQYINEGSKIPPKQLLISLLQKYIEFCGISLGYRTIVYDFAWSILEEHPDLWYEDERESGFCVLAHHFKEYIPGYNTSFEKFDVTVMNEAEYIIGGFNLLLENELEYDLKPAFSFAMFTFFKNYEVIDMQELTESIEEHIKKLSQRDSRVARIF